MSITSDSKYILFGDDQPDCAEIAAKFGAEEAAIKAISTDVTETQEPTQQ